jgi:hypothetical protein
MENNETYDQISDSDIQTMEPTNEGSAPTEEKEITALPYQFIFEGIYTNAKSLGQIVFVDNGTDNASLNTISVIRLLTSGEKQFFKITVEETKEITLKK